MRRTPEQQSVQGMRARPTRWFVSGGASGDPASWTRERIDAVIRAGKTRTIPIDPPLPVAIVYWTASISRAGKLRFSQDAYDYDRDVRAALDAPIKRAVWWPAQ